MDEILCPYIIGICCIILFCSVIPSNAVVLFVLVAACVVVNGMLEQATVKNRVSTTKINAVFLVSKIYHPFPVTKSLDKGIAYVLPLPAIYSQK